MALKLPRTVVVLGVISLFNDLASEIVVPLIAILLAGVLAAARSRWGWSRAWRMRWRVSSSCGPGGARTSSGAGAKPTLAGYAPAGWPRASASV